MKIIILSSPAVTAQANEWLAHSPTVKVVGLAQSEDNGVIHLTMLYEGEEKIPVHTLKSATAAAPV